MELKDFTNLEQWATEQWGQAELGDSRRQARAVALGAKLAARPGQSLPQQLESWSALKAAYRLLNERDVTHQALSEPHWQLSREQARGAQGVVLFVQDRTELDYSQRRDLLDVGHIRKGKGRGLVVHNCLAVLPHRQAPEIIGLAHQSVWVRKTVKKGNESRTQRGARRNEGDGWAETVESIGPAPPESSGTTWVSVADRESDVFSYIRRSRAQGWHCLVRHGHRWLIEEYHKCLKSGCALEQRQLATEDGLERLLGFLAIVAVKFLQVRTFGQQAPDTPAQKVVPPLTVNGSARGGAPQPQAA